MTATSEGPAAARPRLAFLNTHPIQYFAPLYRYLQAEGGFDVTALYLSDHSLRGAVDPGYGREVVWDVDLLSGYRAEFVGLAARTRSPGGFLSLVAPEVWGAVRRGAFDALVINGHSYAASHVALAAARASGTPVLARGDTNADARRSPVRAAARAAVLRGLYSLYDGALAVGSSNARHYLSMGVPPERVFLVPFAVDNLRFAAPADRPGSHRAGLRARFGISPDLPAILFLARLHPRKRPMDLLAAFGQLLGDGVPAQLVIAGSGPQETALRAYVAANGLPQVHFTGFVNQAAAPDLYAACDVFVLPSGQEPWGLVVNEAMCARLPVIVTRQCGCHEDLVEPGRNGAVYEAGDVAALREALRPLLLDPALRQAQGEASRARIDRWSFRECAEGLHAALARVRRPPAAPPG